MTTLPQTPPLPRLLRAGDGQPVVAPGEEVTFKLTGRDTNGALALGLVTTQPGGGPPPHIHHREDELFILVEGELQVGSVEGWMTARAGDVVFLPAGSVHTFHNAGVVPSRHWVLTTPPGFEQFYPRFAAILNGAQDGPPDLARLGATATEYGIELLSPHALPPR
ncbi:cupin domain-containing protein [Deinococcus apachensis]|uniref:cupin domain-containing protein n=1 Tax=Deinococcus apachensis TaxID=309886 RepID=UPI00036443E4|nr:cupin domain-containing protein [Deinococcus apachensis]